MVWGGQTVDLMGKESEGDVQRGRKKEKMEKGYRLDESEWTNSTLFPSLLLFSFVVFCLLLLWNYSSLSIYLSIRLFDRIGTCRSASDN